MLPPTSFHRAVCAWFDGAFAGPTPAQTRAWREIQAGRDVLVAAPTGSGKTLAAFLASLDALVKRGEAGALEDGIDVVYVSPLKALSSDVQKNLEAPLAGIRARCEELGLAPPAIRTALRTGDTTTAARAAIARRPPHVLITTPESLYLMLTAERTREHLARVSTVIVDEVHALMRDKRGTHLALSLARLDRLVADEGRPRPQRVGLSATVHPIEDAARFLVGAGRDAVIVDVGHRRDLDLAIEVPATDLEAVATHEQWAEIYDRIAKLTNEHRTTLVFVNTRKMAERVAYHLGERLGEGRVAAHHGSLAKERRLKTEQRLKAGDLRAIVATASLELGIDVGAVDLVCQIGTPRAVTTFLQRIGRSGHALGRTSRGRLFATSRDELVECAALMRAVRGGRLDRVEPPVAPLDVLAQQIVAECATRPWREDDLFALVREAAPYATLAREAFDEVVATLAEGPAPKLGRARAWLHRDRVNGVVKGRRGARLVAITNGGAIPDVADYKVVLDPDETLVGTVNEDWAIESSAGDVFVLGSHSWRVRRVESRRGVLRVDDAKGQPPSVPFWLGEAPSRTWELSGEVSRLREELAAKLDDPRAARAWLALECSVPDAGAAQIVEYARAQRDALGVVPTMDDVVFERFFDEAGGMQLVVHAPFGGRVNRALGLAMRKRFCVSFDFELQAAATDDAIVLSIGASQSFPLEDAFRFVRAEQLDATLEQAVLQAPMFGARWRWNATRALALLRFTNGKKVPPFIQRMRAEDLLAAVFPAQVACQDNAPGGPIEIPEHPIVRQTVRDCLDEAMDATRLRAILEKMERGEIRLHARDTTEPSPFAHEILNAKPYAFLDDAPLEERRARAVSLRRTLPEHQRDLGALDADAIARVVSEASPAPRDADELHDVLMSLVIAEPRDEWGAWLAELGRAGRVGARTSAGRAFVFATERAPWARAILAPDGGEGRDDAVLAAARGFAEIAGPFTSASLATRLGVEEWEAKVAIAKLEAEGIVLRGRFTPGASGEEACDRRLLARIHRQTLDRLRSEIEPVSAQDFMRFLLERHRLAPSARAGGRAALRDAVAMLQGFEIAAAAWERDVLGPRVAGYRPEWLDAMCLAGEVAWARLTPRRATSGQASTSRATPITLAKRADVAWLLAAVRGEPQAEPDAPLGDASRAALEALKRRGALFESDLLATTRLSRDALAAALWDLVARGLVTSDGFQALRDLMAPARRAAKRRGAAVQGRWSLVDASDASDPRDDAARDELADRVAEMLLVRYGVAFRELAARESFTLPWRDVARALRRREARGLARGGRFVAGFVGEQYGLPEAVDALRRVRRKERKGEVVRVRAGDPLNLAGVILPGPRVHAGQGGWIVLRDGAVVAGDATEEPGLAGDVARH